jgi:hypothetical protein
MCVTYRCRAWGHRKSQASPYNHVGKSFLTVSGVPRFLAVALCFIPAECIAVRRRHYLRYVRAPVVTAPRAVLGRSHLPMGRAPPSPNPTLTRLGLRLPACRGGVTAAPASPCGVAGLPAGSRRRHRRRDPVPRTLQRATVLAAVKRERSAASGGPSGDSSRARRPMGRVGTGNVIDYRPAGGSAHASGAGRTGNIITKIAKVCYLSHNRTKGDRK